MELRGMDGMKKWLALLAIAALVLSLGGCGGSSSSSSSPSDDEEGPTSETVQKMLEAGEGLAASSASNPEYTIDLGSLTAGVSVAGMVNMADSTTLKSFDLVRHIEPSRADEYYTVGVDGEEISEDDLKAVNKNLAKYAVYVAHDIVYYPELDESGFKTVTYDDDPEYAYYYTAEGYTDYIFGTLPYSNGGDFGGGGGGPGDDGGFGGGGPQENENGGERGAPGDMAPEGGQTPPSKPNGQVRATAESDGIPTDMMHPASEAYKHPVLHITKPGTYTLKGEWKGQIWVDLQEDKDDVTTSDKVTLILNGVTVKCAVAPALVFHNLYECGPSSVTSATAVDTSPAGANVVIADGTTNTFTGTNVYRLLKPKAKDDDEQSENSISVTLQSKRWKMDGAFYSFVSMNIDGGDADTGTLTISSDYEGLDSELHLTVNGGTIEVEAEDDGINVNEDGVSVFTMNGGTLTVSSKGNDGDGIDSNGWIVVKGGNLTAKVSSASPGGGVAGLDADYSDATGIYVTGGTVTTDGVIHGGVYSVTGGTLTDTTQSSSSK
ncbi:MAG: carbohydrate-binding domain-containing protein [Fretibacterium sp.]|nr:carbohydrate-binding domain-containing protein [Fretibacterium sp.]